MADSNSRVKRLRLFIKVVELRLRFVALMAITALTFAYWDEIGLRYEKWMRPVDRAISAQSGFEHFCPMHPQVVQADPGSCPICGMPLAKRKKGEKAPLPADVIARVTLSSSQVAQAGIKTVEVGYAGLSRLLTTVGYIALDERLFANIISKAPGRTRVETLHVNTSGQKVEVGQTLAELYSPELSQGVQELINASKRLESSKGSSELANERRGMFEASVEKLKRWGVTGQQVDMILKRGKSDFTIPIVSPIRGFVFKKNVVQGQEVSEGYPLFEIADLETVWVQGDVFEHQLGMVREGDEVVATVEAFPAEMFHGKVDFIEPKLDPATRAASVRIILKNHDRRLLPGMFATLKIESPLRNIDINENKTVLTASDQKTCPVTRLKLGTMGAPVETEIEGKKVWTCCDACPPRLREKPAFYLGRLAQGVPADQVLSVPERAVIDTGLRKIVYIETDRGVFEGREVHLGERSGDRYPVIDGLMPGENVAADGAFLIDAESRINSGTSSVPRLEGVTPSTPPVSLPLKPASKGIESKSNPGQGVEHEGHPRSASALSDGKASVLRR